MDATLQTHAAGEAIRFGRFCLHPDRRMLVEDDKAVYPGSRALDILPLLMGRSGEVVPNDEIVARV
jgi:DNA-binding winged helix-turn-helix (wHTH) protein